MIGMLGRILSGYNTRALYRFDGNFNDSSPNAFHLNNNTGVTTIPIGKFEGALRNQGSTGYGARRSSCVIAAMAQPFSIGGWFKLNALPTTTFGLFGCNEGSTNQYQTYLEYLSSNRFRCDNISSTAIRTLTLNEWHNAWIVRVISPSSLVRMYLNGEKIGEGTLNPHSYIFGQPSASTKVSCSGPGSSNSYPTNGYFDDVCFLAYALSESAIREIFTIGRGA